MQRDKKCLALFSGGLDSILAVLHMQKLGYEVIPIFFSTPFFTPQKAKIAAEKIGVKLEIHNLTKKHLHMLVKPMYGYGKNMNPCIDCHGLMFRETGALLEQYSAHFIISGEVLGQRPMSQRLDSLNAVGKLSKVKDLLIRPLSQKLLPDTKPIREGWVNKTEMLDIQGRTRKRQLEMIKDFGIKDYETPGGGCLLTDFGFSKRLKDLMEYDSLQQKDIEFLKVGRHFRINDNVKLIIGRNNEENEILGGMLTDEIVMQTAGMPGPFGVTNSKKELSSSELEICAGILLRYNSKVDEYADVSYGLNSKLENNLSVYKMNNEEVKKYLI